MKTTNISLLDKISSGYENHQKARVKFDMVFKKVNKDQQTVTGQVYAPYILDSHTEMMEPEDVEFMCHTWMSAGMHNFDIMHDNVCIDAKTIECFIARGHPDWDEGAWVVTVKIADDTAWKMVKSGQLGGFSVEAWGDEGRSYR